MSEFKHDVPHAIAIVCSFVLAVAEFIIGLFSYAGSGVFKHSLQNLSHTYETQAFPAYPYPVIGPIVYALQIPWTIYNLTLIWRKGPSDYLYKVPNVIPLVTNVGFSLTAALNIAWFFLWDNGILIAEIIMLGCGAILMAAAMGGGLKAFETKRDELENMGLKADIYCNIFLFTQGIAAYTAWFFLQTCLHSSVTAFYKGNMTDEGASTMALALYAVAILFTIGMHDFAMEKQFRYGFANYAVWVALLIPILANFDPDGRNYIFALVLLIVILIFFVVKVVRFCAIVNKSECIGKKTN